MSITKWYKWSLLKDKGGFRIRRYRYINGKIKWEELAKDKYAHLQPTQYASFIKRLNATREVEQRAASARYEFDSAFINQRIIEAFESSLSNRADSKSHITNLMSGLWNYTITFFIHTAKLPDPNKWREHEDDFGAFLLKKKISTSHLKMIVQVTNRFLKFLHKTNPNEINQYTLEPLSNMKLKPKRSEQRLKYIDAETYSTICKKVDSELLPAIQISYNFGLRCAEVMGLNTDDVFEDCLDVKRQQLQILPRKLTGPLKNKLNRSVPYWFATAEQVYTWINETTEMHSDTLSKKFVAEMKRLQLPYEFHDLRRTFITRALREQHYRDVQLAVGHSDLKTTMLYAQDDRQLQRVKFKPKQGLTAIK